MGALFPIHYTIQNTTFSLVELNLHVESSDSFVFGGYKQCSIRLLPLSSHTLSYNCMPLLAGKCILPKLKILRKGAVGYLGAKDSGSSESTSPLAAPSAIGGSSTNLNSSINNLSGPSGTSGADVAPGAVEEEVRIHSIREIFVKRS